MGRQRSAACRRESPTQWRGARAQVAYAYVGMCIRAQGELDDTFYAQHVVKDP